MSNILMIAKSRKSSRIFRNEPIPDDSLKRVLEVGCMAPSGANYQPWRFLVVTSPDLKKKIRSTSEACEAEFYRRVSGDWGEWLKSKQLNPSKPFLEEAPVLIVVISEMGRPYSKESVWISIGYMLLALEEEGLSTVTYTPSYPHKVAEAIGVPSGFLLESILPIGYSADNKPREERRSFKESVFWEHF